MKKISKVLLSLMLSIMLTCGFIPVSPLREQIVSEVEAKTKVGINKTQVSLYVKKTTTLKVTGVKGQVKWSTSNKNVVTVSNGGVLKAVKKGTAVITATVDKKKFTCKVSVKNPSISKKAITLKLGKTTTLSVKNAVGKVKWSSSNKKVASVNSKGVVKAVKKGTATITAVASGVKLKCTVKVTENDVKDIKVTGLSIAASSKEMKIGKKFDLAPVISPANAKNKAYTVSSSNPEVASVNKKGVVTAIKDGTAKITVKTVDQGIKKDCIITVKTPIESLTISEKSLVIEKNETKKISCSYAPKNINVQISYSSDNEEVAKVSQDGTVQAITGGVAHIKVTAKDIYNNEKTEEVTVTVPIHVEAIQAGVEEKRLKVGESYKIVPTILPEEAQNKKVTFKSSHPEIVQVDNDGLVRALTEGQAVITIASDDVPSIQKTVKIIVQKAASPSTPPSTPPSSTETKISVDTQEKLDAALQKKDITEITISTQENVNINIPEEDYSNISLEINAPNGHVENKANFKEVTIQSISGSTFVEHASGNTIQFAASTGSIKIAPNANASIVIVSESSVLKLKNDGTVSKLEIQKASIKVEVTGDTRQRSMPIIVGKDATNTSITTSVDTSINAEVQFDLIIKSGAENTSVSVNTKANIPKISGIGRIPVTVEETNTIENIIATPSPEGTEDQKKAMIRGSISGGVGATVFIIPYKNDINFDNPGQIVASTEVKENGSFAVEKIPFGNYYLYINQDGYIPVKETLIVTQEQYVVQSITLVEKADEKKGNLIGTLSDAQTGGPVEAGLTVYIREGRNNVSGNPLAETTTTAEGTFTFVDRPFGDYTIQVIDKRGGSENTYVSVSYNASVLREGDNIANHTITKVISSEQVRFVLTWGDERSGASSDLDSHLVGPTEDGTGQFHTWYSDESYNVEGRTYAVLDVDDTTWEGPETSTIYINTRGTYSFYVHDYSNSWNLHSQQMGKSSAVVKAYIGNKEMAQYACPAEEGNLWYVCDYNSNTNQFTSKNEIYKYDDALEDIGIDLRNKYQTLLRDVLTELKQLVQNNPSVEVDETVIQRAEDILANSEDTKEIMDEYYIIKDILSHYTEGLDIRNVSDENSMIYEYDISKENGLNILEIYGFADTLPEEITIELDSDDSKASVVTSDKDEDGKLVVVTNQYQISKSYYIVYYQSISLRIKNVSALGQDDRNLISDWYIDYDSINDKDSVLYIEGYAATLPDNLTIQANSPLIGVKIEESDLEGYAKKVVLSYVDIERVYYISYSWNEDMSIQNVSAPGQDDRNLISDWYTDYDTINDDEEISVLYIKGYAATLPDNLTIQATSLLVGVKIEESDLEGYAYEKKVVLSYGDIERIYYISYSLDGNMYIQNVYAQEDDRNLISDWYTYDDEEISVLYIEGYAETLSEDNLTIVINNPLVDVKIENSDLEGYAKKVVLSYDVEGYEELEKTYYIIYRQYVDENVNDVELQVGITEEVIPEMDGKKEESVGEGTSEEFSQESLEEDVNSEEIPVA